MDPTPVVTPLALADGQGMTFYEFVLALVDKPAIGAILFAFAGVLTAFGLLIRYYAKKLMSAVATSVAASANASKIAADAHAELKEVRGEVNGKMSQLLRATEEKAFAAGVDKGAAAVAESLPQAMQPPKIEVQVVPPPPRTGLERTRATDQPPCD